MYTFLTILAPGMEAYFSSGSFSILNQETQSSSPPWWFWLLVIIVIIALVWWWLNRKPVEAIPPPIKETPAPLGAEAEKAVPDDLTLIEGIGPKISTLLQAAGITTFVQLAATETSKLEQILKDAGIRLADPGTWAEQARFAAAGDMKGLQALQDQLKGGREVVHDDLTLIEGIGPKISALLQAAGITTFAKLAATETSKIEQILRDGGIRLADPGTWAEQARLAAAGDKAGLQALQDRLKGGRR